MIDALGLLGAFMAGLAALFCVLLILATIVDLFHGSRR